MRVLFRGNLFAIGISLDLWFLRLSAMFQFLPGIIIAQLVTGTIVYFYPDIGGADWPKLVGILLVLAILIALWFGSIAKHISKDAIHRMIHEFNKEKDLIRLNAEKDKNKIIQQTHKQITKETQRAHGKANLKVGAAFAGAAGAGILMLLTELLTMGLLTLTTAGGALAGYFTRARQESRTLKNQQDPRNQLPPQRNPKVIETKK